MSVDYINTDDKNNISDVEVAEIIVKELYNFYNEASKKQLEFSVDNVVEDIISERYNANLNLKEFIVQFQNVRDSLIRMNIISYNREKYFLLSNEINEDIVTKIRQFDYLSFIKEKDNKYKDLSSSVSIEEFGLQLISFIQNMQPREFEYLTVKLFRAYGLEFYAGKGVADDGIDGYGYYILNDILKFKIIVQCKRYKDGANISNNMIRDLRGAVSIEAYKGIFVTTSSFTPMAKREAEKFPQIELIDGRRLSQMIIEKQLGINKNADGTYEIIEDYFKNFDFGGNNNGIN